MRDEALELLRRSGFEAGAEGGALLCGPAALLRDRWVRYLARLVAPFRAEACHAPLFAAEETLQRAGYLAHFPQHVVVAGSYDDPAAPRRFITPAACLHLYPRLTGRDLARDPFAGFVVARCARHEAGSWEFPFRLVEFHMAELVVVAAEDMAAKLCREAQTLLVDGLRRIGLHGEMRVATDAFFLGNDDGARIMQKLKELKKEYVVSCAGREVAIASLNRHETYFTRRFGLNGKPAEAVSFCLAFGVERLTACALLAWGADESGWPEEMR